MLTPETKGCDMRCYQQPIQNYFLTEGLLRTLFFVMYCLPHPQFLPLLLVRYVWSPLLTQWHYHGVPQNSSGVYTVCKKTSTLIHENVRILPSPLLPLTAALLFLPLSFSVFYTCKYIFLLQQTVVYLCKVYSTFKNPTLSRRWCI